MIKAENKKFHFQPVDQARRSLVHHWLKHPHVAIGFYWDFFGVVICNSPLLLQEGKMRSKRFGRNST